MGREDAGGLFNYSAIYRLNDEFQIIDSCLVRKIYERPSIGWRRSEDYILYLDSTVYLYYPYSFTPQSLVKPAVLRDTLYRLGKNHLVPELKLKFKNDGIDGGGNLYISLNSMYRSSRYIFAEYYNYSLDYDFYYPFFWFCYDTKTGKGYNMQDGYTDDIHQIEDRVNIRPFNSDTEMFYYLHTPIDPDDLDEPNPTLYIGRLKK
jgi:hypothetical protein